MIESKHLTEVVKKYKVDCKSNEKNPTYREMARRLNVDAATIKHILSGCYKKNKPYTNNPHVTRCVRNADFEMIVNMFDPKGSRVTDDSPENDLTTHTKHLEEVGKEYGI